MFCFLFASALDQFSLGTLTQELSSSYLRDARCAGPEREIPSVNQSVCGREEWTWAVFVLKGDRHFATFRSDSDSDALEGVARRRGDDIIRRRRVFVLLLWRRRLPLLLVHRR